MQGAHPWQLLLAVAQMACSLSWADTTWQESAETDVGFETVKHKKIKSVTTHNLASGVQGAAVNSRTSSTVVARNAQTKNSSAGSAGKREAGTSGQRRRVYGINVVGQLDNLKAGVRLVRKAVFHVDNICSECTPEALKVPLSKHNIEVLSCFTAKSWLRSDDKDTVSAFRVCISASDTDTFLNPELWPKGVILRNWIF